MPPHLEDGHATSVLSTLSHESAPPSTSSTRFALSGMDLVIWGAGAVIERRRSQNPGGAAARPSPFRTFWSTLHMYAHV